MSSGHLRTAAIIGNNGMVLGSSKGLDLKKWELNQLVDNFHVTAKLADTGINFMGNKYNFLGTSDSVVRAALKSEKLVVSELFFPVFRTLAKVANASDTANPRAP